MASEDAPRSSQNSVGRLLLETSAAIMKTFKEKHSKATRGKTMNNSKVQLRSFRCAMICLVLLAGFLTQASGVSDFLVTAKSAVDSKASATKYRVFCDHESHGRNGYSTIYCYDYPRDAADVANAHNRFNAGHSARVVTCN
ncbi:MAG: hypothetical protein MSG64_03565 [Pyrinomonadaceae bacterium MAG19_C2-C3]|nr:hypothetical protein [Pyrinomonadaceae bacterium MAG19_C2-C3]